MTIRVTHGMASVELASMDYQTSDRLMTRAIYPTDDLIEACRRALEAADDARAADLADLIRRAAGEGGE